MRARAFFHSDSGRVCVTDSALAAFAYRGRGIPFRPCDSEDLPSEDITLKKDTDLSGIPITLAATAAVTEGDFPAVTLTVGGCRRSDRPEYRHSDSARLVLCAYLYASRVGASAIRMRMVLSSGSEELSYEYCATLPYLTSAVGALLSRAEPFLRHIYLRGTEGALCLRELPFPYPAMRESQYEFITEAFRTVKSASRLLVSAPTGTGKTISALYPCLRAVGEGYADKIFCLCAKTTVGKAFTDAAALLSEHAPHLRCTVISSKERCCPEKGDLKGPVSSLCRKECSLWSVVDGTLPEARLHSAAAECLRHSVATAEIIKTVAEKHSVCPHELSLLLSEYSDVIICDYNYVFDFRIRLKRYFEDDRSSVMPDITGTLVPSEKYVFLADEVHNLPARAEDTYSASLSPEALSVISAFVEDLPEEERRPVTDSLRAVSVELASLRKLALREGESREIDGVTVRSGFTHFSQLPEKLSASVGVLRRALGTLLNRYGRNIPPPVKEVAESFGKFCHVCSLFDTNYTCFASAIGDSFYLRLICLDPSPLLDRAMEAASAVIFFSATLTPISYFADILGCGDGAVLELDSPFPRENLCPVAVDSISMRLSDRDSSTGEVAEMILSVVDAHPGNYISFFPSFDYMEKVSRALSAMDPDARIIMQKRSMKAGAREAFLNKFRCAREDEDSPSLLGLAVLGGIFSEGIDLPGDALVGVIICGTGMPAITSERNIMKEYFENTREGGMEYAYTYPGFNHVLQAAGRVIRTDSDRGVLVLIDSRYAEPSYFRLFPKYWRHIKYTSDPFSLSEILRRFWEKE